MRFTVLGDGLFGHNAARVLRDVGHDVRVLARAQLDLDRPVPRGAFEGADVVVNAMGAANVDWCEEHPAHALRVNAAAAGEVASEASAAGARLVHVSTDYVLHPVSEYARTKALGEALVSEAQPDAIVMRVATTFGPHPRRKDFVKFVVSTLREKGEVSVVDDMWSSPTYAPEAGRFVVEAIERGATGVFHVANAASASRYDIAVEAQNAFGALGRIVPTKFADFKWRAPRAQDTRMPMDAPAWWRPLALAECMRDYAKRGLDD